MSDSFADIWASSAPPKPTSQQQQNKLGSNHDFPRRPQHDAFSILSASQPSSRPAASNPRHDRQGRPPPASSSAGDAFSGLFNSSLDGGGTLNQTNLTMAERAVLAQKAKGKDAAPVQAKPDPAFTSLWDGLDSLARPTATSLGSPPTGAVSANDNWGLSEFSSPASPEARSGSAPVKPVSESSSLWDISELASSETAGSHPPRTQTSTPADFDFGDREDGPLGDDNSDAEDTFGIHGRRRPEHPKDDILGDLGKLVSRPHYSPKPSTLPAAARPSRPSSSPPPHITGQLVEMGFSPVDARAALANTMTEHGFDVQTAAELLLSQAAQEAPPPEPERRRNGRDRVAHQSSVTRADSDSHPASHSQTQLQPQLDITTEKLLSQASEIGRGMFNRANALWKEGKERAVKIYEERTAASVVNGALPPDGRPRWMRGHDHGEWQRPEQADGQNTSQTTFKDDDEVEPTGDRRDRLRTLARSPPPQLQPPSQPSPQPEPQLEVNLFSADSPVSVYQSPFRRGKSKAQVSPIPTPSTQTRPPVSQTPRPLRTFTTTIALASLTSSTSHKAAGTDAYKRGDFPVALASYVRALSALPPEHISRLPILTNVALVRSKLGELRDAIKACEDAVVIVRNFVGGTARNGRGGVGEVSFAGEADFDKTSIDVGTGKVTVLIEGEGSTALNGNLPTSIDIAEGLSKAFKRRADALEGLEKWEAARSTWEAILGAEWAGAAAKGEAMNGMSRCRKMVDGQAGRSPQSAPSRPRPPPKPKPTPSSAVSQPSAALAALQSTYNAQQTEDAARLACKDAVDASLTTWKAGREGNIRALLTSLDESVLWPELGWRKVGLSEVVSKGQVKVAYMRAIAKVHPDKLNAGNTTVEQRMVANGVFGTLNDAWNVFQQQ